MKHIHEDVPDETDTPNSIIETDTRNSDSEPDSKDDLLEKQIDNS